MVGHWTYRSFAPDEDLEQGDIIAPRDALRGVFTDVHPHFAADKYLAFMVATQTCDLVRRDGRPKAPYVNLTVVRSLRGVLPKLLTSVCTPVAPGVFLSGSKTKATELLQRIVNQNEQALGLFYVHGDAELEIGEPAVALLRVGVALRAEHYGELLSARVGRLAQEYQAKLGWLLGNLFARPATKDWADYSNGHEEQTKLIRQLLAESDSGPWWVDDARYRAANEQGLLTDLAPQEFAKMIEGQKTTPPIDRLADLLVGSLAEAIPIATDAQRKDFVARVKADNRVKSLLKGNPR